MIAVGVTMTKLGACGEVVVADMYGFERGVDVANESCVPGEVAWERPVGLNTSPRSYGMVKMRFKWIAGLLKGR